MKYLLLCYLLLPASFLFSQSKGPAVKVFYNALTYQIEVYCYNITTDYIDSSRIEIEIPYDKVVALKGIVFNKGYSVLGYMLAFPQLCGVGGGGQRFHKFIGGTISKELKETFKLMYHKSFFLKDITGHNGENTITIRWVTIRIT